MKIINIYTNFLDKDRLQMIISKYSLLGYPNAKNYLLKCEICCHYWINTTNLGWHCNVFKDVGAL